MHILVCPNAFKHSVSAQEAAAIIIAGLKDSGLLAECIYFPIGDGGDGTGKLIIEKCDGKIIELVVHDSLGEKIHASYGLIENNKTAVIEMAAASGLSVLQNKMLQPMHANSYGTGEQIKDALDKGVTKIIIALGGSATTDGATGMLQALGAQFLNADNKPLQTLPKDLIALHKIDLSNLDKRLLNCEIVVLCDVENILLGNTGAAATFAPQKGATKEQVQQLEACLSQLAAITQLQLGKNIATVQHGGAAGGAAAGLCAFANAKLFNGIEYFLQLTNFDAALKNTEIIVTAEGSIDQQTLQGKGPFGVAKKAKQNSLFVVGLAGTIPLKKDAALEGYFDVLLSINNTPCTLAEAIKNTRDNLYRTSYSLGKMLASKVFV